jgi:hypothetical protein
VPPRQHLAAGRLQVIQLFLHAQQPLGPHGGLRRRGVLANEPNRESRRRRGRQHPAVERHLRPRVVQVRARVVPVQLQQPLADDQAQPQE